MLARLRQIDFENSGLITLDSFISIGEKYGVRLCPEDLHLLKNKYRKSNATTSSQSAKVDYVRALEDLKLKIDFNGGVGWAFGKGAGPLTSPYRVKIQKIEEDIISPIPLKPAAVGNKRGH